MKIEKCAAFVRDSVTGKIQNEGEGARVDSRWPSVAGCAEYKIERFGVCSMRERSGQN